MLWKPRQEPQQRSDPPQQPQDISDQLLERRPLPMGRQEFEAWSDRIISGAMLNADVESQKFTLANLLLHLGPTESHKEDAFFIHSLRKFAGNQVADAVRVEIRDKVKLRLAKEEAAAALSIGCAAAVSNGVESTSGDKVLADRKV
jgi:hypothetical protein